jgi:hypothetical protein
VSGSPGSGKSFIGTRLGNQDGIAVVETDGLIQHHIDTGKELLALEHDPTVTDEQYTVAWRRVFGNAIRAAVADAQRSGPVLVVLVGILNHWGGGETLDLDDVLGKGCYTKLFLDIDCATVIERYYRRLSNRDEYNQEWWDKVASGDYAVSSSTDLRTAIQKEREWHTAHGYSFVNPDSVVRLILRSGGHRESPDE